MKKFLFSTLLLLLVISNAKALIITSGSTVVIEHAVHEDIYISAGTVLIEAPVYGSLIVAGGTVTVKDSILNDILIVGGELNFYGYVGGTVRCAGGRLKVASNISRDLVAAGGTLSLGKKDTVGGDLVASAGNLLIDGVVNGNSRIKAGSFVLHGVAGGDLECRAETIDISGRIEGRSSLAASGSINITDNAFLRQDVRYWTPDRVISTGRNIEKSKLVYDPALKLSVSHWYYFGVQSVAGVLWYLGMALLMIFILQYLFSASFRKAGVTAFAHTGRSFLTGIVYFIAIPLLAILCFISLIGIPIGIILLFVYIGTLFFSGILTALVSAHWLQSRVGANWKPVNIGFVALGLLILLRLVAATPFLGFIIFCILVCIAIGAILQNFRSHAAV